MNILVIAAHPDDEVLGCGATVSRLAKEGNNVSIAILGEGLTSRYAKREDADAKLINDLREKALRAKEILKGTAIYLYDFPDNRFDTIPLLDVVKKIEALIEEVRPRKLFTHHAYDLNIDHVITHRAVLTAARPLIECPVREIYTFEVPSSTEWAFGELNSFSPDTFFDVGDTLELKVDAMAAYESELRTFPHPRSPEAIRIIAKRWGSVAGIPCAEAFKTIRRIM